MVELSTPVRFWFPKETGLQSKGCRFNSCPFHSFSHLFSSLLFLTLDCLKWELSTASRSSH